jgi:Mg2+-importing ATPase
MLQFGVLSSLFDFMTFAVLLRIFASPPALFRTGWFVESLLTELLIALVVRTRRPFLSSRPGKVLLISTAGVAALALVISYLPVMKVIGLVPLPPAVLAVLLAITGLYVVTTEVAKARFYKSGIRR